MQNVTLLLQEWLSPPSTGSRNTGHGGGKKQEKKRNALFLCRKVDPQPEKRPQIFKIQMKVALSTQIHMRKISLSKPLSSRNIVSLESLRYYSSMKPPWKNGETDLAYRWTRWKPIYSTLSCKWHNRNGQPIPRQPRDAEGRAEEQL